MKLLWSRHAWQDYVLWQAEDKDIVDKINALVKEIQRTPFAGLGKPEPLREHLSGWWSRRITGAHRLVYRVEGKGADQRVEILQCRFHY
jgi:toxin YoeB